MFPNRQSSGRQITAQTAPDRTRTRNPQPPALSRYSTPAIPDSLWFASDFLLGAGMVIIQPSTDKIVLVYDGHSQSWFLPKGRKDVGESLEQAALREAYEESGYRAEFLPLCTPSRAPAPGSLRNMDTCTEPIYVSTYYFSPRRRGDYGGEYLTFWYVGSISENAVREQNTGMPDEQEYVSHLLTVEEAIQKLGRGVEAWVVRMAWTLFLETYTPPSGPETQGSANQHQDPRRSSDPRSSRSSASGSRGRRR